MPRFPLHSIGGLTGSAFSTATAGYESDPPTSVSSSLVHSARASLILYSWERISDTTNTPAVFDQRVIYVGPIGQKHIGKGVSRLVAAVRLEDDFLTEGRSWAGVVRQRHQNFLKRLLILHRSVRGALGIPQSVPP